MLWKTFLSVLLAVCLLIFGGFVLAQSISISISPNPIERGTAAAVTMTFSGLPTNTNLSFRAYVSSEHYAACEGAGLGGPFSISTGSRRALTRTGTIASSCPAGQYTLEVALLSAGNTTLAQSTVSFAVVRPIDPTVALGGAFQRLGAIGLIYRKYDPELNIEVWGITPESAGFFLLRVTQSEIDATQPQGLVASSPDGHAAVHVGAEPERNVIISLGPNTEGKVHHVVLANGLDGTVISTFDTEGGPPGVLTSSTISTITRDVPAAAPPVAPPVVPQDARADGSIIHIVRAGDTVNTIAQAYGVNPQAIIERNQLTHGGRWIYPGQELVIRDATATAVDDTSLPEPVYKGDDE